VAQAQPSRGGGDENAGEALGLAPLRASAGHHHAARRWARGEQGRVGVVAPLGYDGEVPRRRGETGEEDTSCGGYGERPWAASAALFKGADG
jgi:hypothetical protein